MTNLRYVISVPYFVRIAPLYLASIALISVGCGRIDLGDDLGDDLGPDDVSAGDPPETSVGGSSPGSGQGPGPVEPDPEPEQQEGCTEYTNVLAPTNWPFQQSADGYKEAAWTALSENGCNAAGPCHGGDDAPPKIALTEDEVANSYQEEFDDWWLTIADAEPAEANTLGTDLVGGTFWYHHPNYPGDGRNPFPLAQAIDVLNGMIAGINACNLVNTDAVAQEASSEGCGPDTVPDGATCYCSLLPANVPANCAPPL